LFKAKALNSIMLFGACVDWKKVLCAQTRDKGNRIGEERQRAGQLHEHFRYEKQKLEVGRLSSRQVPYVETPPNSTFFQKKEEGEDSRGKKFAAKKAPTNHTVPTEFSIFSQNLRKKAQQHTFHVNAFCFNEP
jgi:hypothetical protein